MRRRKAYDRWFNKTSFLLAWAGVGIAFLHPPHGLDINICWLQATTGAPCPGCGITRALSSAAHGMLAQSWQYHPFGIPILLLFGFTVLLSLLPASGRRRFAMNVIRHHQPVNVIYLAFIATFTAYGLVRSILYVVG